MRARVTILGFLSAIALLPFGAPCFAEWKSDHLPEDQAWSAAVTNKSGATTILNCRRSMLHPPKVSIIYGGFGWRERLVSKSEYSVAWFVDGQRIAILSARMGQAKNGNDVLHSSASKTTVSAQDYELIDMHLRAGKRLKLVAYETHTLRNDAAMEFDLAGADQHLSAALACGMPHDY